MPAATSAESMATAAASIVRGTDPLSTVHALLPDLVGLVGAEAAAVLVLTAEADLEPLAATSHQASSLEHLQAQARTGPCIAAITAAEPVRADLGEVRARWPLVSVSMRQAGYVAVQAVPMRWRGRVVGGLNVFWSVTGSTPIDQTLATVTAFADTTTVVIAQSPEVDTDADFDLRLRDTLDYRATVERAKGALAVMRDVDLEHAYNRLVERASRSGEPLVVTAQKVLRETYEQS